MIEDTLVYKLRNTAAVSSIVSTRIYAHKVYYEGKFPAITYARISAQPLQTLDGAANLDSTTISIGCWSTSYEEVTDLARKVRAALDGTRGTIDGTDIRGIFSINENHSIQEDEATTKVFHLIEIDFDVWYRPN